MTIIDRSDDGLVLESLPDGSYAWLRPAEPETQPVEVKTATPADLLRDHHRFERWLNEQPADQTVGVPLAAGRCPIATYLQAEGFCGVQVGRRTTTWNWSDVHPEHASHVDNPRWVIEFTRTVDGCQEGAIRASHARALLHQVVRGSHD